MIAEKMGLPTFLVDIRHEATHEQLPTLNVLRNAAVEVHIDSFVFVSLKGSFRHYSGYDIVTGKSNFRPSKESGKNAKLPID